MRWISSMLVAFLLGLGAAWAGERVADDDKKYAEAAKECRKYAEQAQPQLKEMLRLLERIAANQKVETNRGKLLAAWGQYRQWNDRIDECMKAHFDNLPRIE